MNHPGENQHMPSEVPENEVLENDRAENDRAENDRAENDRAENDRVEKQSSITRRELLLRGGAQAAALGLFHIVPAHVLGGPGRTPPSETVTHGILGSGGISRSPAHIRPNVEGAVPTTLAICDVDSQHLANGLKLAGPGCTGYSDWREVLERKDIDVIHICTPPQRQALMAVAAARAGFDIWCEKPMSRTVFEGIRMQEEVEKSGVMFRLNTWFRFRGGFYGLGVSPRMIKKLILSGRLGENLKVRVSPDTGFPWKMRWIGDPTAKVETPPPHLDYDAWLGPAPYKPYTEHRVHGSFRGYWDYDGGGLSDMGQHYLDPVQWMLDKDETSPIKISSVAPWPQHPDCAGPWGEVTFEYADGTELILESREWGDPGPEGLPYIEGSNGKVFKGGRTEPEGLFEGLEELPDPPQAGITNFEESVKTRQKFALNEANGHRSCSLANLANISIRTGRTVHFDPVSQTFPEDTAAQRFISPIMRAPWNL